MRYLRYAIVAIMAVFAGGCAGEYAVGPAYPGPYYGYYSNPYPLYPYGYRYGYRYGRYDVAGRHYYGHGGYEHRGGGERRHF